MTKEKLKILLDFDGNLTDEPRQAAELAGIALDMLADLLGAPIADLEALYAEIKKQILSNPHLHPWEVNGLPACYAYEGAYLLNTVILQQILKSEPRFLAVVTARFPADSLDSVTHCVNHLFHNGSLSVNPHFLPETRDFLISLLSDPSLDSTIFTNSQTQKIAANLRHLEIGVVGANHPYEEEIAILGDTRQYHLDANWPQTFPHPVHGPIQVLPVNDRFWVDLRRPVYHAALKREIERGYRDIIIVADGFSLAGALPLMMGLSFIFHKTGSAPDWAQNLVASHPRGRVATGLPEIENIIKNRLR